MYTLPYVQTREQGWFYFTETGHIGVSGQILDPEKKPLP